MQPGVSSSPVMISAHQGEIACLAMNQQGTMVATASDKVMMYSNCLYIMFRVWNNT